MPVNKIKIIFLSLIFLTNSYANPTVDAILNQTKNHPALANYVPKKDLKNFEKKLKDNTDIGIRIYGDSHMAADFFPRVIRGYLIKSNSIGFAYPLQPKYQQNLNLKYSYKNFEILNSKNPATSNISFPLGGVIAKAKDKGAKIDIDTKLQKKNFKVGFLFKAKYDTNAFSIKDSQNKSYKLRSTQANKWSYKELELNFPLQITSLQKDAQLGGYFIINNNNNVFLDTVAINGAKSDLWLSWNKNVVQKELQLLRNNLIIIAYGSNDALFKDFEKQKFKNNLKKWIKTLKPIIKTALSCLYHHQLWYKKKVTH